jgi:hypothetical protein
MPAQNASTEAQLARCCVTGQSLLTPHRRRALEAFGSWLERSIGRVLAVTLGSGYGVRLIVLRSVGRVARVRFGIEV